MNVLRRLGVCLGLAGLVLWVTGCSSTSPVLLQLASERGGTAEIPLKVGIQKGQKPGEQRLSDIKTCTGLNCWTLHAKMPRRDEVDYFSKSLGDYFRDTKVFSYCYDEPFDMNDVNVVLTPRLEDVRVYNSGYGTFMAVWAGIPYLGLPVQLGELMSIIPQELYRAKYRLRLTLSTPAGKEIAVYNVDVFEKDAVTIYEQPYGNYMWYDSVFQKAFFKAMDQVALQMKSDRVKIMQAVGK